MALLEILKFPDPRLRIKAKTVSSINPKLKQLAQNMLETMKHENGVGLAATQIAQPIRLLTADTSSELQELNNDENSRYSASSLKQDLVRHIKQPLILFNPEILSHSGQVIYSEGCLSFPSYYADVKRAEVIEVKAMNEQGKEISFKTDGLLSVCIQHEIDHLNGKLFIDHLSPIKAKKLKEEIKKNGYPTRKQVKN
ncbi:MAG: peptide deformylase [Bdellovibrionales bacterium]|nr:peptide deformylase [Bdellovibrionales bacterium]